MRAFVLIALGSVALAACQPNEAATPPAPMTLTAEAAGHFCQMTVVDHPGPKAQVHFAGSDFPLWFTQVRDAIAFDRMPEESVDVTAIYVSDMSAAASWDDPGANNWIDMRRAHYVIGSSRRGGMGAPELVPFSDPAAAREFAAAHGGRVIAFAAVTDDMVLAPIDVDPDAVAPADASPHLGH